MEKAKNMLQEKNIPIKKIAIDVGYTDVNYFSKAFKKYEKMSPKQYVYQLEQKKSIRVEKMHRLNVII